MDLYSIFQLLVRLDQAFQLTFQHRESAATILLKGDSGVGKSYIVSYLAEVYKTTIYTATLGELAATYRGQLSKGFKRLIWKATATPDPCVVLIEDLDLFFPRHGQDSQDMELMAILNTLLKQEKIMLVATSRRPEHIALNVRTLFQDEIHLQIPTPDERFCMMNHLYETKFSMNTSLNKNDIKLLSSRAHAFVAADIAQWCRLAEEDALCQNLDAGKTYIMK